MESFCHSGWKKHFLWADSRAPPLGDLTNGLLVWQGHPRLWKGNTDTCLRGCKDSELVCIEGLAQKRWSQWTPALSSPGNHFRWSSQSPTGNYLEVVTCEPSLTRVHEVGPWSKTTLHENNWNGQLAPRSHGTGCIPTTSVNLRLNEMNSWQLVKTILVQAVDQPLVCRWAHDQFVLFYWPKWLLDFTASLFWHIVHLSCSFNDPQMGKTCLGWQKSLSYNLCL